MRSEPGSPRQREREEAGACSGGLRWGSGGAQLGWALRWHQDGAIAGSPGEGAGESGRESGKWSFSGQDREGRAGTGADAPTSVGSPFLGWGVAAAVYSRENAASYTGLDRVKATKPEPAETWVKGID